MSDIQQNLTIAKTLIATNEDRPLASERDLAMATVHAFVAIAEALSEINDRDRRREVRQALEG